ncbi:SpoIIE family protein phosphatase [Streptomyces cadmiisoli]|nr:SpoIIE family protein phosphatase [Streptomyces cadmiisoli]
MTITDQATAGTRMNASDVSGTAFALLDQQGMVVAWTHTAEQLVGYCAGEVVGRSAALVLPSLDDAEAVAVFVDQCIARNGWPGATAVRHRDGRVLDVSMRMSRVWGRDGTVRWIASVTDIGVLSADASSGRAQGALLARAPIGVVVRDLQLRCAWLNDVMESQDGVTAERRLGCRPTDAWPSTETEATEAVMRQVLECGTTKVREYRTWLPAGRGPERPFAVSFSCLQGADGRPLGVCAISVDVTERQQVRERLAVLGEAGTRFGRTLDVMQTGQELADLAVPLFADFVTVDLVQSAVIGEGVPVRIGSRGERLRVLRRAGLASIHQGVPESPWGRGEAIPMPPEAPFFEVLRTGRSYLQPSFDTSAGTWIDKDPARAQKALETGMHSVMLVPIRVRRVLLGVALFLRTENPAPFQEADLLLAEEFVSRAAVSLDNARQYTRQHNAAFALQRTLLPRRLNGGMAVEAASRYMPADIDRGVGGDWFDVIPLSGARVALVIGDVVGHGINAAAAMGGLRNAVRTLADMELPPDELLTRLDDTVQRLAEADSDAPDQAATAVGATCLYAVYDPITGKCTMATAGHLPPAIIGPNGHITYPDLPTGAPLGIGLCVPFEAVELELPEGNLIALYTDGLVETRDNDIDDGMHSLGTALAHPDLPLEELCTHAMQPVQGQTACDDASLLLVRTRTLSPNRVATWTLPSDDTSVRRARNLAAGQLAAWDLERLEDSTKLIVSELITNAVRHSTGPIQLRLIRHQVLTCEVSDTDTCLPRPRNAGACDENGRGLFLVSQLSRRWGSRPIPGGKLVWAEQDLDLRP